MNAFKRLRGAALWIGMALLLCAFAPEAVAGALQAMTPSVWGAAVALGLALITAVNGDRK
jgi:ABC-type amino acid transport system permease subunit